jgi:hypothetical protein
MTRPLAVLGATQSGHECRRMTTDMPQTGCSGTAEEGKFPGQLGNYRVGRSGTYVRGTAIPPRTT